MCSRIAPKALPGLVFTHQEQEVLAKLVLGSKPKKKYTLIDYIMMLARFGGFLARKNDGMPGAEVLWRGWSRLRDIIFAMNALADIGKMTCV